MRLFNTVCLEISSLCNRSCKFCPVAYNTRPDEKLAPALLTKVLTELGQMDYRGRVEFYIYNEPLKDMEYLIRVLRQARQLVPRGCFMLATNGDYLRNTGMIKGLFSAGLNQLLINCYSPGLYARRLPWLAELPSEISQTRSVYAVLPSTAQTIQMLDKSDPTTFGTGIFRLINRAGNIPQFLPAAPAPVERMCVKPFRLLNINWKGDAIICCQDYHGAVAFGNVAEYTLAQLWKHPVMNTYRRKLLKKDRSLPLCNKCDCHAGAYPHNVSKPTGPFATEKQILELEKQNAS